MDYAFDDEKRFVSVRFAGQWTIASDSPVASRVLDECRARGQDLLLVDFSAVENKKLTLAERFRLGLSALSFAGKLRKVAVLGRPDLLDRQRFGELVARNRGVNVRAFLSVDEATQWLLAEDAPSKNR